MLDGQVIINEKTLADLGVLKHETERIRTKSRIERSLAYRRTNRGLTASDIRGDTYMIRVNNEEGMT